MIKESKNILIPEELKIAIEELNLGKAKTNHCYHLIFIILNKLMTKSSNIEHISLSQSFFEKVFNGKYYEWFNPLKKANIIQPQLNTKGKPLFFEGSCIKYRINPIYLTRNFINVNVTVKTLYYEKNISLSNQEYDLDFFSKEFDDLIIPKERLLKQIENSIETINKENFILNENIIVKSFFVDNRLNNYFGITNKEECLRQIKNKSGVYLIQDNEKYYIDNLENYIETKKRNRLWSWSMSIEKLVNKDYYFNRNNTNNRLDNNFTSLPKVCLDIIKKANNLVEIDLANSQFAILCFIMQNDETFIKNLDYKEFKNFCAKGFLYDFLVIKMKMKKQAAKKLMMQIAFSSHKSYSVEKTKFKNSFPTVYDYIINLKKEFEKTDKGHKEFAIMLQSFESELFIDNFYKTLKEKGIWCISKHDSLIVKRDDAIEVKDFLESQAIEVGIDCTFRTDDDKKIIKGISKTIIGNKIKSDLILFNFFSEKFIANEPEVNLYFFNYENKMRPPPI